eukprot:725165-Hanusia_phi.AAC.2
MFSAVACSDPKAKGAAPRLRLLYSHGRQPGGPGGGVLDLDARREDRGRSEWEETKVTRSSSRRGGGGGGQRPSPQRKEAESCPGVSSQRASENSEGEES